MRYLVVLSAHKIRSRVLTAKCDLRGQSGPKRSKVANFKGTVTIQRRQVPNNAFHLTVLKFKLRFLHFTSSSKNYSCVRQLRELFGD